MYFACAVAMNAACSSWRTWTNSITPLGPIDRSDDSVDAVAGIAENPADAPFAEALEKKIACGSHATFVSASGLSYTQRSANRPERERPGGARRSRTAKHDTLMETSTAPAGARGTAGPSRWVWAGTAIAFAIAAVLAAVLIFTHTRPPAFAGTPADGAPAPDFTLQDQDGKPFQLSAQHGNAVVLFFGYAHCPDVCPTTLANLERAKHMLSASKQSHVTVAFVTVDPERDTQRVLKRYVALFDPAFYGLTGDTTALDRVFADYHVWHQKIPSKDAGSYLMAHTSEIYLIDGNGKLRVFHDYSDTPASIAHDLGILTS